MEEYKVVPDVIDVVPKNTIQIYYYGGLNVNFGNELTPRQVKDQPTIAWEALDDEFYTLFMIDPDAHILQPGKQILHWLVGNVPGSDISKGDIIVKYIGSAPRPAGVINRYVFLVYKQNGKVDYEEEKARFAGREGRLNFCVREFSKKYNLDQPLAGNFYRAGYDDYVAELIAKQNK